MTIFIYLAVAVEDLYIYFGFNISKAVAARPLLLQTTSEFSHTYVILFTLN